MIVSRGAFWLFVALFVGLITFAGSTPRYFFAEARAQDLPAALVVKPVSLPEKSLGSEQAAVTIIEYASMSCPHCASFGENVFPMLRSKYIDTGKVRFVFREFPLDLKAVAAAMVARCIGDSDTEKYFEAIRSLFQQQQDLLANTVGTLKRVGNSAGLDDKQLDGCVRDQALLEKLAADETYASQVLNVASTPTFFINGVRVIGTMSFEDFEEKVKPLLKR